SGGYKLEYLLGLLNSKFLRHYYQDLVHESGRVFAQVKLSKLNELPIRQIDFKHGNDKELHDKVVELVSKVIALVEERRDARTHHESTVLKRQIEATLRQIDTAVYQLYGLDEKDVKLIESSDYPISWPSLL
ncbi:MAG: TaqI-like C-terminal specificity domain-containing protein, partial [Candidatus Acidiferrales bacterium]